MGSLFLAHLSLLGSGFQSRIGALGKHKFIKKYVMKRTAMRPGERLRWRRITANSTKSTTLTEVREENMMRQRARILALFLLVTIGAASQYAQAANV